MRSMLRRLLRRHGTAVAYLALFAALGGSSYAAIAISKNSIKSKHIARGQVKRSDLARNAVTSAKVKNFSLLANDFKRGQLPAGPKGDPGAAGPQGAKGDPGAGLAPQEPYHVVGTAGEPAFFDGGEGDCVWQNPAGAVFAPVSFQKDALGRVQLRGVANGANGSGGDGTCDSNQPGEAEDGVVFILPAGYRPEFVSLSTVVEQIAILPDQGAVFANGPVPPGAVFSALISTAAFDDASFSAASAATAQQAKAPAKLSLEALRRPGG